MENTNTPVSTIRNRINRGFSSRITSHEDGIPMDTIMQVTEEHGYMIVDEAGERWSGIFCGEDGQANFTAVSNGRKNIYVHMSWHKMEHSGRYEIVVYAS